MLPYPLTSFEIQKYQNEPKFNGVYSRNNSSKSKDGTYLITRNKYKWIGTHWIAMYMNGDSVTYSDSFKVEWIYSKRSWMNIFQKKFRSS